MTAVVMAKRRTAMHMCQNNYDTLHEYHMDMLQLVLVNPNLSPGGATVGFWVSKVEPGGDWDYKVQPGFCAIQFHVLLLF